MSPSEMIFFNRINHAGHSGLRNPLVKLTAVILPLGLVVYQQAARSLSWTALGSKDLLIVSVFLLVATTLNFAPRERTQLIRRFLLSIAIVAAVVYVSREPNSAIAVALGFVSAIYKVIPLLGNIQAESWLHFIFIYIAYRAAYSLNSRDLLWLGRKFLFRPAFLIYTVCVATGSVVHSILPLRLFLSWRIALDKGALLRNPDVVRSSSPSVSLFRFRLFTLSLLLQNDFLAETVELLVSQRGYFRRGYSDFIGFDFALEDTVAIGLCILGVFALAAARST